MKPQSRDTKLKLLQYLVHMNESLAKLVHKPTSGRKPSRCLFPILHCYYSLQYGEVSQYFAFSFLPTHLYLNDHSLLFNLLRILSSQTGTQRPAHIGVLKTKKPALVLQRVAVLLTSSLLQVQILKGQLSCSCQHNKEDMSRDTVLYSSSTKLCLQQLLQQC